MSGRSRAMLFAASILTSVAAQAQTAGSYAKIHDTPTNSNVCGPFINGPTPGGSSASCGVQSVTNGIAFAYGVANTAARQGITEAYTAAQSSGGVNDYAALASGSASIASILYYSGISGPGDKLVFHFTGAHSLGATGLGGANPPHGYISAQLSGFSTAANFAVLVKDPGYGTPVPTGSNFTILSPTAFDFTVGFYNSGTTFYNMVLDSEARGTSEGYSNGSGYAYINATLEGIDWYSSDDQLLGQATFFEDGTATLDDVEGVPEPASIVLFATGALAIGIVTRRRR